MVIPLQSWVIYGPIRSRRLGVSLGINPLSPYQKICSFDCIYCQYGRTTKLTLHPDPCSLHTLPEILEKLEITLKTTCRLDAITFSGNGEPTLHPEFPQLIKAARKLRNKYQPGVPVAVFTNGSTLLDPCIRAALEDVDLPLVKLDCGSQASFEQINRPIPTLKIDELLTAMKGLKKLILQCLFFSGKSPIGSEGFFEDWLRAIEIVHPTAVQIYSLDQENLLENLTPCKPFELNHIAEIVRVKLGIAAEAFWPAAEWLR
jgi:hypothetical protein